MSSLLNKFVPKTQFDSYEDFEKNFKIEIPENFNFAFDVVDEYAEKHPDKIAMVWCDDNSDRTFTFKEMKLYSDKAANLFKKLGIVKGQTVMLTLKSRYEFWFCLLGLNKIGAIPIPATHMLKTKDIIYRIESADIKMIVCIAEDQVPECVDTAEKNLKTNKIIKAMVGGVQRDGWINFREELEKTSGDFKRPTGKESTTNEDPSIVYFSSGTTGLPKMILHDFTYPLGHIITAKYWQKVVDNGLHYTVADTGWAKCLWGKIYGQWISGSSIFVYDYD